MNTTNLSNWLAQSDSRETEILAAIFAVAENKEEETLNAIWDDPEHYDVLVTIYEIVTQNGLNGFFLGRERLTLGRQPSNLKAMVPHNEPHYLASTS
jgi:hypothetical protein